MTEAKKPVARKTTPKAPQDRKPKAVESPAEDTLTTQTVVVQGLSLTLDQEVLDDIELMEEIAAIEDGNPARLPVFLRMVFGEEQYAMVKNHLADPDTGKVTISAVGGFFTASTMAMQALKESNDELDDQINAKG